MRLRTLAIATAVAAIAAVTPACAFSELRVPSLEFNAMAFDPELVRSLQQFGVVTLRNVPGYAALRSEYLRAAAACAWQRRALEADSGILHRTLDDGTLRLTISSIDGVDNVAPEACPDYQRLKQQFGDVLARAIDRLGAAFDAATSPSPSLSLSAATVSRNQSLHALVSEAEMMDHFHAYVPAGASSAAASNSSVFEADAAQLALGMHSDSGVFIAMSAPAFFAVAPDGETLREIANPDPAAGLLVKLRDGSVARPSQPPDELTVMVGDGFASWTRLSAAIPAVVHAMLMPQTCRRDAPVLRAWHGRMVLLPNGAAVGGAAMDFAAYSRQLGELVAGGAVVPAHLASVACPAGGRRRLQAGGCSYRICHPFSTAVSREKCAFWCNAHTMDLSQDFAAMCKENCVCSHHAVTKDTYRCWMSCFEEDETCAKPKYQSCRTERLDDGVEIPVRECSVTAPPPSYMARHHHHHHHKQSPHVHVKVEDAATNEAGDGTQSV